MVVISFDDAVTVTNYQNYSDILNNRLNPNGCPIKVQDLSCVQSNHFLKMCLLKIPKILFTLYQATFFVSHEYNNYTLVNDLYKTGNEIAIHSIT